MQYRCVNPFTIDLYDDSGMMIEGYFKVGRESIWGRSDEADMISGEVHLNNQETMEWLEISEEDLKKYFKPFQ